MREARKDKVNKGGTIFTRSNGWRERIGTWRRDTSDRAIAQRVAGSAYLIRVFNAAIALLSQILLARWMGEYNYGIYAYIWIWVIMLSAFIPLGMASATQRFIPEYTTHGDMDGLRGFLFGSAAMALTVAFLLAAIAAAVLLLVGNPRPEWPVLVFLLGLACLPLHALAEVQDGVARSHNWVDLALGPIYVVRPVLLLVFVGLFALIGTPATAVWALIAALLAVVISSAGQWIAIRQRLRRIVPKGPRRFDGRRWLAVALPMFLIDGFYLLLTYVDVLLIEFFRTPEDVAIYYAATKIMALGAFVSFAVTAATAHRFSEYAASGNDQKIAMLAREAALWTFWPTLLIVIGLLIMGKPLLWLFGSTFTAAYAILPILGIGLLARASIGPAERMLSMLGQQNITAAVYLAAFIANLILNLLLIPRFGIMGAATGTVIALAGETVLLYLVARRRVGVHVLFAGGPKIRPAIPAPPHYRVEELDVGTAAGWTGPWQDLTGRTAEPNAFYDPGFALSAAHHLGDGQVRFLVAVRTGGTGRIDAVVPVIPARRRFLAPMPLTGIWPAYAPLATPLLDKTCGADAFAAVLDHLARQGERGLFIPRLSTGGGAGTLMHRALETTARRCVPFEVHERALLRTGPDPENYLRETLSTKKRHEYARLRRRLEEMGTVSFEIVAESSAATGALERFLALESKGWKGRRGTALAADTARAAFVREAMQHLVARGLARIALLSVGGHDVAAGLVVQQNGRAFYFKTAYDEDLARCSPGVMLTLELTRHLLADPTLRDVDSVADANHPMIDHIWRDRLAMADWWIELRPGGGDMVFDIITRLEAARRRVHAKAKSLRDRLRKR